MALPVVDATDLPGDRRCLGVGPGRDRPLCEPADIQVEGAILVESLQHVTCPVCIAITNVPITRLVRPGEA